MCGCEPGWTCPRCTGTPSDDAYPELPDPRETDEAARYAAGSTAQEADDGD